jgi:drug/metabolite transporter (DMT)-like permease
MAQTHSFPTRAARPLVAGKKLGIALVAGSAILWSFGGTIARFITVEDPWTVVFWRALFAATFIFGFMLWRDGVRGTFQMFRAMGFPGLGVATCFAIASSSFVIALQHTTVANILLIQAAAPLFAALLAWVIFGEKVNLATGIAIAAVIFGVGVMVSSSFTGKVSPIGDGLALVIVVLFSCAIVITRHSPQVRMTPAMCLATAMSCCAAFLLSGPVAVSAPDLGWLYLFGAINLGLGLAMFATGARLIPAALAALVGTLEPALGPIWVWLVHGEVPGTLTIIGGSIVFAALVAHILTDWRRQKALPDTIPSP